ncbi:diacylglyceryl transferase [Flavobacteriaceae bacterium]|nr:diacylglyceryl transferase [Flavobacteriaceae bacterium]
MYFDRLKAKWDIQSNVQFVIIFIVFGLTGSLSLRVAKPVLHFFHITLENFQSLPLGGLWYWTLRILIIFPVYQILLLLIGTVFFQFKFFWNFEKKILRRIGFKRFFKEE